MQRMVGGQNSDGGDITQEMSSEKNVKTYLDFFPYFKTLSKMCHLAMTVKKEVNTQVKIHNGEQELKRFEGEIHKLKTGIEFLKIYEHIKTTANNITEHEIKFLDEKQRNLDERFN